MFPRCRSCTRCALSHGCCCSSTGVVQTAPPHQHAPTQQSAVHSLAPLHVIKLRLHCFEAHDHAPVCLTVVPDRVTSVPCVPVQTGSLVPRHRCLPPHPQHELLSRVSGLVGATKPACRASRGYLARSSLKTRSGIHAHTQHAAQHARWTPRQQRNWRALGRGRRRANKQCAARTNAFSARDSVWLTVSAPEVCDEVGERSEVD